MRQINPAACLKTQGESVPVTTAGPQVPPNSWSGRQGEGAYPARALQEAERDSFLFLFPPGRAVPAVKTGSSRTEDLQEAC